MFVSLARAVPRSASTRITVRMMCTGSINFHFEVVLDSALDLASCCAVFGRHLPHSSFWRRRSVRGAPSEAPTPKR